MKHNYDETFSPTPQLDSLRLVIAYCASRANDSYGLYSIDFVSAFLNAISDPEMYVTPPGGINIEEGKCWRLKKALYGSSRAPRLWHKTLEKFLGIVKFDRSVADACMYCKRECEFLSIIFFHVDDLIICARSKEAKQIIKSIEEKFEIHDLGFPSEILGIQIQKTKIGIHLCTNEMVKKITGDYEMEHAKPTRTPLPPGIKLPNLAKVENSVEIPRYRRLLGKLLYVSRCVRYDMTFAVHLLSTYSSNHNKNLFMLLKNTLRYLKNKKLELVYKFNFNHNNAKSNIEVYSDASYGDDETGKRSTIGNLVLRNGYVISWQSGKTKCITLSTCESEFLSASEAVRTALFLKNINDELLLYHVNLLLHVDNQSCMKWIKNNYGYQAKTKHIGIRYHFMREMCHSGLIDVKYIATQNQLVDIFTKPLTADKHLKICETISNLSSSGEC